MTIPVFPWLGRPCPQRCDPSDGLHRMPLLCSQPGFTCRDHHLDGVPQAEPQAPPHPAGVPACIPWHDTAQRHRERACHVIVPNGHPALRHRHLRAIGLGNVGEAKPEEAPAAPVLGVELIAWLVAAGHCQRAALLGRHLHGACHCPGTCGGQGEVLQALTGIALGNRQGSEPGMLGGTLSRGRLCPCTRCAGSGAEIRCPQSLKKRSPVKRACY